MPSSKPSTQHLALLKDPTAQLVKCINLDEAVQLLASLLAGNSLLQAYNPTRPVLSTVACDSESIVLTHATTLHPAPP